MSDQPVRDKDGNLMNMWEPYGLRQPDMHTPPEPLTRMGEFLAGLREAQTNPDYQPTSRIGQFVQRLVNIGRAENGVDYSQYSSQQIHDRLTAQGTSNPEKLVTEGASQGQPVLASEAEPATKRNAPAFNTADAAVAGLANGSANRDDIRALEQATIENLNTMKAHGGDAKQLDRALGVMNADGRISGNEYKVFQALLEKSGVDLSGVGVSSAKDIDTTQELGKALAAMQQQRSNGTQVG